MSDLKEITEAINSDSSYTEGGTIITCPNHFVRRMFRCWLDGSYKGQEHYKLNKRAIKRCIKSELLPAWALREFFHYMAYEFESTPTDVARCAAEALTLHGTELLAKELAADAYDLVADELEDDSLEHQLFGELLQQVEAY